MPYQVTVVELYGWGEKVAAVLDRLEQAFFVMFVAMLFLILTAAWTAVAVSLRR